MSRFTDGGPVHPGTEANGLNGGWPGMTLRDYLAAKAMPVVWADIHEDVDRDLALKLFASGAYEMADAMLKARDA